MCTEQNCHTVLVVLSILFAFQLNQFHFYLIPIRIHWIIPEGNSNHQILRTIFYLSCILIHHFLLKCLTLSLPNTLVSCLYLYCCCLVANSCPALYSWTKACHELQPARLHCLWDFPGKSIGAGFHLLLQRIFLTQGSN